MFPTAPPLSEDAAYASSGVSYYYYYPPPAAAGTSSTSWGSSVLHHPDFNAVNNNVISTTVSSLHHHPQPQKIKKKRSLPGNPEADAEVIALSPKSLLATNRYVCEICHKGFQREQNLQLHRRGHNLPWKLNKQRSKNKEEVVKKKAYVCPEPSCVHHNPSRALGDLTGIKKHYCRKHGEKKWKCDRCSKLYAVQSDWKAHSKTCGTREYTCDCGAIFSRKDSFITHRAFCDALAEETERLSATQIAAATAAATNPLLLHSLFGLFPSTHQGSFHNHHTTTNFSPWNSSSHQNPNPNPSIIINNNNNNNNSFHIKPEPQTLISSPLTLLQHLQNHNARRLHVASSNPATSATALLQMAATVGAISTTTTAAGGSSSSVLGHVTRLSNDTGEFGRASQQQQLDSVMMGMRSDQQLKSQHHHRLTRDFLGLTTVVDGAIGGSGGAVDVSMDVKDRLTFTGRSVEYQQQQSFGFFGINSSTATAPDTWGN